MAPARPAGLELLLTDASSLRRGLYRFGPPAHAFDLVLSPERQLAREDIAQVLENLDKQGYHLQMPPPEEEYIQHLPDELLRRNDPV